ncbi:MAG: DNA-directed RNA polymerase subunit omega [Acidobacteria bacterium]|nr:DNA-directed RNA polymerase subunit omega [Acidobacteriota bacterium]
MTGSRKKFVEQALSKVGSRYLVCSLVSKRANQFIRHPDSQGVAWAVNQALQELVEGRIRHQAPTPQATSSQPAR